MPTLNINGQSHNVDVDPNMPLLWALRENVGLTGTGTFELVAPQGAAIDADNNESYPSADQGGLPRPADGNDDGISIGDIGGHEAPSATEFR